MRRRESDAATANISKPSPSLPQQGRATGPAAIAQLNAIVAAKTSKACALAKANGSELDIKFRTVLKPLSPWGVWAGTPVYASRPVKGTCLLIFILFAAFFNASFLPPHVTLVCCFAAYLNYDLFSGILHVALDDPRNIAVPFFGQAALEFQWHHEIPTDIVAKDFMDAIGDLNVAVLPIFALTLATSNVLRDRLVVFLAGLKLLMAWFGQFSHRSAHNRNAGIGATALQRVGLMISVRTHKMHHAAPHEEDFCLIGICNPVVQLLFNAFGNRQLLWWLFFAAFTTFDNYIIAWAIRSAFAPDASSWYGIEAFSAVPSWGAATNATSMP